MQKFLSKKVFDLQGTKFRVIILLAKFRAVLTAKFREIKK